MRLFLLVYGNQDTVMDLDREEVFMVGDGFVVGDTLYGT